MSLEDWFNLWNNPGGPDPDDHDDPEEEAGRGWSWDEVSLACGEYVGFKLYLQLRDRLCSLAIPKNTHNRIIIEMIHTHDDSAIKGPAARSTLVYHRCSDDSALIKMDIYDGKNFTHDLPDLHL